MRRYIIALVLLMLSFGFSILKADDIIDNSFITLGKRVEKKNTCYEFDSVGGVRFIHDKIYDKNDSKDLGYNRRKTESITGLWTELKFNKITLGVQLAYTYDTYKYDRADGGKRAYARYHGYSVDSIIEARCVPLKFKWIKISPVTELSYEYTHERAFTEKYINNCRHYDANNSKVLSIGIGTFLERDFNILSHKCWIYSKLLYSHVLDDSNPAVKYTVNNTESIVHSNFRKKDGFKMNLGTAANIFSKWDIDISYQLFTDDKLSAHAAIWKVCYNF